MENDVAGIKGTPFIDYCPASMRRSDERGAIDPCRSGVSFIHLRRSDAPKLTFGDSKAGFAGVLTEGNVEGQDSGALGGFIISFGIYFEVIFRAGLATDFEN